jgi:alpha-aminoadipate/glutamate carrier protein LysW
MKMCECPMCNTKIDLAGCEEDEIIECPDCGVDLEIVSLTPPVLEALPQEDDDWDGDDNDDWDDRWDDDDD